MSLLYHAYVYLEFLILACTIYILAPNLLKDLLDKSYHLVLGGFSKKKQKEILESGNAKDGI